MKLVLDIPDEISAQLSLRLEDPAHAALEALAAASYSQGIERKFEPLMNTNRHEFSMRYQSITGEDHE